MPPVLRTYLPLDTTCQQVGITAVIRAATGFYVNQKLAGDALVVAIEINLIAVKTAPVALRRSMRLFGSKIQLSAYIG
jgi:hypothetical protein